MKKLSTTSSYKNSTPGELRAEWKLVGEISQLVFKPCN